MPDTDAPDRPLLVLIAGPYLSGTNGDPTKIAANRARLKAFFDELEPLRRQFGCSFGQLMIAWTLASGSVSVALCGARTRAQATENATAGALELPEEAVQRIDDAASHRVVLCQRDHFLDIQMGAVGVGLRGSGGFGAGR